MSFMYDLFEKYVIIKWYGSDWKDLDIFSIVNIARFSQLIGGGILV